MADIEPVAESWGSRVNTRKFQAEGKVGSQLRLAFLPGDPHHGTSSCCTLAVRPRISPLGAVFLPPPCPHLCIVPAATFPHGHRDEMREADMKCFFSPFLDKLAMHHEWVFARPLGHVSPCAESPHCACSPLVFTVLLTRRVLAPSWGLTYLRAHPESNALSFPFQAFLVLGVPCQVQLTERM